MLDSLFYAPPPPTPPAFFFFLLFFYDQLWFIRGQNLQSKPDCIQQKVYPSTVFLNRDTYT